MALAEWQWYGVVSIALPLFLGLTCNCFDLSGRDFSHEHFRNHDVTGEELHFKSHGKLRNVINVDEHPLIKSVRCDQESGIVQLASNAVEDLIKLVREDAVLVGGAQHKCSLDDNGEPKSFIRNVLQAFAVRETLRIYTVETTVYDCFEYASFHFHHNPGSHIFGVNPDLALTRSKREAPGYSMAPDGEEDHHPQVNQDDIPDPMSEQRRYKRDGLDQDSSFGKWLWPAKLKAEVQELNVAMMDQTVKTGTIGSSTDEWHLGCNPCRTDLTFAISYNLHINRDKELSFFLQVSGQMDMTINSTLDIEAELSKITSFPLSSMPVVNYTKVQLLPSPSLIAPSLFLELKAEPFFVGELDALTSGSIKLDHVREAKGNFTASVNITGKADTPVYDFTFVPDSEDGKVQSYDFGRTSRVQGAVYPEIRITPSVSWHFGKHLFGVDIQDPVNITFKSNFDHTVKRDVTGAKVCLTSSSDVQLGMSTDRKNMSIHYLLFGFDQWKDVMVENRTSANHTMMNRITHTCVECCKVNCEGPNFWPVLGDPTLTSAIGPVLAAITSGSAEYNEMPQIKDPQIYFTNSAEKHVSQEMNPAIMQVSAFVAATWKTRRLIVKKCFDGSDPASQHAEGRAAELAVTVELTPSQISTPPSSPPAEETDATVKTKLGQLMVCAGFMYVREKTGHVLGGVKPWPKPTLDRQDLVKKIENIGINIQKSECDKWSSIFTTLTQNQVWPSGKTAETAVGPIDKIVTRFSADAFNGLYQYGFSDVAFKNEERSASWCGFRGKDCNDCKNAPAGTTTDKRCDDRTMTLRMALRLRRLATVMKEVASSATITVEEAWDEPNSASANYWGEHSEESQHYEGRALKLTLAGGSSLGELAKYAQCAGFDFVNYDQSDSITVMVLKESSEGGVAVPFLSTNLISVDPPFGESEYNYPKNLSETELHQAYLFDTTVNDGLKVSDDFYLSDFTYKKARYVRLHHKLVECLQIVRDNIEKRLRVLEGYLPRSANLLNTDEKPVEERLHAQAGQSVRIQYYNIADNNDPDKILELANTVMRRCSSRLRYRAQGVGIGVHSDRVYVDIRTSPNRDMMPYTIIWKTTNGFTKAKWDAMLTAADQIMKGGPEISPLNDVAVCTKPVWGWDNQYLDFPLTDYQPDCNSEIPTTYCLNTAKQRKKFHTNFKKEMDKRTKIDGGDDEDFLKDLTTCLTICGYCTGEGPIWKKKVLSCASVFRFYLKRVEKKAYYNNFAFYNLNTKITAVKDLACKGSTICTRKTDAYSLFSTISKAKYKPDPDLSIQELVFHPTENANPALEIMEQSYAMKVSEEVKVYIGAVNDFAMLYKVLKAVMVYNTKVTNVKFVMVNMKDIEIEVFREALQRRLEVWSGTVCPKRSRIAIAPFTMVKSASGRRKRDVSEEIHDKLEQRENNWENDWLSKTAPNAMDDDD